MNDSFVHIPVLLDETIDGLEIKKDGIYVDATAGGGGHSERILSALSKNGLLVCIDQDPYAINALTKKFGEKSNVKIVKDNFCNISNILDRLNIPFVDGVLMDIGVSSPQIDIASRGFSFHEDAPLDMRMSSEGVSAQDVVNSFSWQQLAGIFSKYGEEKYAKSIAIAIVKAREEKEIKTTLELAEIIKSSVPFSYRREGHPARKVYQALRIHVNKELQVLETGLDGAFAHLNVDGHLAVITFHSLEDRIVKNKFKEFIGSCTCPPDFPVCICGYAPKGQLLFKKPKEASKEELEHNPRSRSAKLRVIVKL